MEPTSDINIVSMKKLISPKTLKKEFPLSEKAADTVASARKTIANIMQGTDDRILAIVGPCSIHDATSAREYAQRLTALQSKLSERFYFVMRVYFEKPRTSVGWRGFIVDPHLDGSHDIETGLREARKLLLKLGELGIPCATEVLDPIVPQYIADLISWAAIGARTTESQTHRDITSGLSMPVGFKNGTDGNLEIAINAMAASREPKSFIGIDQEGQTCVLSTKGNPWGHVILRGGKHGPNYSKEDLDKAETMVKAQGLFPFLMVDCSHSNSSKDPNKQPVVLRSLIQEIQLGRKNLRGIMVESHLFGGHQSVGPLSSLRYGVSVTDGCLAWEDTERAFVEADAALKGGGC